MKYKVGDKVRIQSKEWYKSHKNKFGEVWTVCLSGKGTICFDQDNAKYCGKVLTIAAIEPENYAMVGNIYAWTDEMIEGLAEEETKFGTASNPLEPKSNANCLTLERVDETKPESKFKVGDIIISDVFTTKDDKGWKVINVERTGYRLISVNNSDLICDMDFKNEHYYKLVEDETPKFKVNDIVFVKNLGWVRITNSYWDSLANEYIYEAIGFNGEREYDCINQSNIECQMLPESENPHTGGNKITLDEYKNNDKEWLFNKLAMLDNITALESIQDIFNHLQQSKYPKTYEECCKIIHSDPKFYVDTHLYSGTLETLYKLLICRDAYWKIYGEEKGLGKPWKPDWNDEKQDKYGFYNEVKYTIINSATFVFPTAEMRYAFYENFKELIESVKELV